MARPSTIDRLDPQLKELIGRLRERGATIDQILTKLRELDVDDVSRSALGRHVQKLDKIGERIRSQRALAEALVSRFGDQAETRIAQLNVELLHGALFRLASAEGEDGEPVVLDGKEAFFVASALKNLVAAEKQIGDVVKLRQDLQAKVDARLREAEEAAAKSEGAGDAPPDMAAALKRIREDVYGIFGS